MASKEVKEWALSGAISITKEAARGGTTKPLDTLLEDVYNKIITLSDDLGSETR